MNLRDVCLQILNCATLYPEINEENHDIHLTFAGCNGEQVLFICKRVHSYKIVRHPDDKSGDYFVGEVSVEQQLPEHFPSLEGWSFSTSTLNTVNAVWLIAISGAISIRIICLDFSWELL
jgi:hypothetical protein